MTEQITERERLLAWHRKWGLDVVLLPIVENDNPGEGIRRELARLRRQAMFGLLSEEGRAKRSRLLVQLRILDGEHAEEVQDAFDSDDQDR